MDCIITKLWTDKEGGICMATAGKCPDGTWPEPAGWFMSEGAVGHDDSGWRVSYAHLQSYGPNAALGAAVKRGELLGYSGNTGVHENGQPVDPHLHVQVEWLQDGWVDTRIFFDPQLLFGKVLAQPGKVQNFRPGRYLAPAGAVVVKRGQPAATAMRQSVVVNVSGNGVASMNLGKGASISGSLQMLPEGIF